MENEITDTAEIAERQWDGHSEPGDVGYDIAATREAMNSKIEFHVQMRGYTMREMDGLIVEAAAQLIVGKHNEREITKAIEAKCIELLNEKATRALDSVTSAIIDEPLTPNFGDKKPVTMREFLGLYGREFLEAKVDWRDGKPAESGGYDSGNKISRAEYLVRRYMDSKFKTEIEKATYAAIAAMQTALKAEYQAILEAEKKRFRDALSKATT